LGRDTDADGIGAAARARVRLQPRTPGSRGAYATIITSQLPREQWHDYLGEPTVADAILDRVVHRAVSITLTGPSRRKEPPRPESREA